MLVTDACSWVLSLFLCRQPRVPLKALFLKWHVSPFCCNAVNCFSYAKGLKLHNYLCRREFLTRLAQKWCYQQPQRHIPAGPKLSGQRRNIRAICWETFCRLTDVYCDESWAHWYLLQHFCDRLEWKCTEQDILQLAVLRMDDYSNSKRHSTFFRVAIK